MRDSNGQAKVVERQLKLYQKAFCNLIILLHRINRSVIRYAVVETKEGAAMEAAPSPPPVRIVAVVGEGASSPLKGTTWSEVMLHPAKRLKWVDDGFEMHVFTDNICQLKDQASAKLQEELRHADILIIVAVTSQETVKWD